jgi:hypothetical protein
LAFTSDIKVVAHRHVFMSLAKFILAPYLQGMQAASVQYKPRRTEETILYKVVEKNLEAFLNSVAKADKHIPKYVIEEFEAYLGCGRLENGFARLKCNECDYERLLPFSCKRRGFCPSCCGRRMNEAEIRIAAEIFPRQNARQWVLSLPVPLRYFSARNRSLLNEIATVFSSVIERLIRRKLKEAGVRKAKSGGILFIQRIGGALNLNVHFHAIFIDGGYTFDKETGTLIFQELGSSLTSQDVAWAVERIFRGCIKILKRRGLIVDDSVAENEEPDGIGLCDGSSIKNLIAYGPRAGQPVRRLRIPIDPGEPRIRGDLVADLNGFNLKADKVVKAHQRWKLARLVRYVARPPVAIERLSLTENGREVRYTMKNPWSDGTTEVRLSGIELVEKLAAAVPPPRGHLTRYLGVLAPNASLRRMVVPKPKPKARDNDGKVIASAQQRLAWAELAKRTFGIDLTRCDKCGGNVRRIAVIHDPKVIDKILAHLARAGPHSNFVA